MKSKFSLCNNQSFRTFNIVNYIISVELKEGKIYLKSPRKVNKSIESIKLNVPKNNTMIMKTSNSAQQPEIKDPEFSFLCTSNKLM